MAQKRFRTAVDQLREHIANIKDKDGYTPLHLSSFYGDHSFLSHLLRVGGDPLVESGASGRSVLAFAKNEVVRRALIDLKEAARQGDDKSFTHLINCGNDINERKTIFNIAPLHNVRDILLSKARGPTLTHYRA